jgi:hypothetical protein
MAWVNKRFPSGWMIAQALGAGSQAMIRRPFVSIKSGLPRAGLRAKGLVS